MAFGRTDNNRVTDEEMAFLTSTGVPAEVRKFAAKSPDVPVSVRASAYRKLADAAKAERDALVEVRLATMVRENLDSAKSVQRRVAELESERRDLTATLANARGELIRATSTE